MTGINLPTDFFSRNIVNIGRIIIKNTIDVLTKYKIKKIKPINRYLCLYFVITNKNVNGNNIAIRQSS